MFLQTGERISVAIKTCKDCSSDIKEKFLSEAGKSTTTMLLNIDACFVSLKITVDFLLPGCGFVKSTDK